MRIAISPDENPGDPGAVHNGIVERDVNIKVATALQAALQRCGQDAWFDAGITFEERVAKANSDGTQLLVACAHNAATSTGRASPSHRQVSSRQYLKDRNRPAAIQYPATSIRNPHQAARNPQIEAFGNSG